MKIGILTFWWSDDNYGQLMQCYALQKYLRDSGHESFLIRYKWTDDVRATFAQKLIQVFNPIKLWKYIRRLFRAGKIQKEQAQNNRKFSDFRNKYINQSEIIYNSYNELKQNPPEADVYIVGSDQVWRFGDRNLQRDLKKLHAYFLDFGSEKIRRMSYAASWGTSSVEDDFAKEIEPLLKKFEYVSVREQKGLELCKKCGVENAEWVCDPTLLIQPDTYRSIYKESEIRKIEKPFILLYMLRNDCNFDIKYVYKFAEEKGLDVVYVTGNGVIDSYNKYFATIPEWLYLIDNAKYIITNSFHCCVFSSLFRKQYAAVPLSGRHVGMNTRLESLFILLNIEQRFIIDYNFDELDKKYNPKFLQYTRLLEVL